MERYITYKNSGNEWIGDIPNDWEIWKLGHAFNNVGSGSTPESGNSIYHDNGTINWLNTGDLNDGVLHAVNKRITPKALEDYSALKLYPANTVVIAMYGATIGKTSMVTVETATNQACCVFYNSLIVTNPFLFYYFLSNKEQIINLSKGGGQPNISQDALKNLKIACPPIKEQNIIVGFLEQKTFQIDKLIADKQKLIELLNEERTAVINHAVTKGIAPDVPMKDSGVDWLGEIPEHWQVMKLRHLTEYVKTGNTPPSEVPEYYEPGELDWFTPGDFASLNLSNSKRKLANKALEDGKCRLFPANSVLLVGIGATLGKVGVITKAASANQQINAIVCDTNKLLPEFLAYFLDNFSSITVSMSSASTLAILNQHQTKELIVTVPSQSEQLEIVAYIKKESEHVFETISVIKNEIDLLKEYRLALISEVVTGKLDVRHEDLSDLNAIA